ncbi:MAG: GNAT family N-acetyltransferase [FCB group bacterium]|nr:GNAT family N-acetyltransferase [FCB group bacterium]
MNVMVRRVNLNQVRPLRHRVLRPGRSYDTTLWDRDTDDDTAHFAAFSDSEIVAVGTVFPEAYREVEKAARLRGMATAPEYQGKGYGFCILDAIVDHAREKLKAKILWCNAREIAFGFYERYGFRLVGDPFELPLVGWHKVGVLEL